MTDQATQKHLPRKEQVKRERRRKRGPLDALHLKLSVNEKHLDRNNFEYRWINDTGARVQQMFEQDWETVPDPDQQVKPDGDGAGTNIEKYAGQQEHGGVMKSVLVRKPIDWHKEDQAEKQNRLDEIDASINRGKAAANDPQGSEIAGKHGYVPDAGISIQNNRNQ